MKKTLAFVILLLCVTSFSFAEGVTFRNIPWGADIKTVEKAINPDGLAFSFAPVTVPYSKYFLLPETSRTFSTVYDKTYVSNEEIGWMTVAYYHDDSLKVAGYPVSSITAYSVYGVDDGIPQIDQEHGRFYAGEYSFSVRDSLDVYLGLQTKLNTLYGDYTETVTEDTITTFSDGAVDYNAVVRISVWDFEDEMIVLSVESNDVPEEDISSKMWYNSLRLAYVSKTFDEEIKTLDVLLANDLDQAEKNTDQSNYDGL